MKFWRLEKVVGRVKRVVERGDPAFKRRDGGRDTVSEQQWHWLRC